MAAELDEIVDSFRNRPPDAGPYTFVWLDALTQKVREGGRTVNVHCLIATGPGTRPITTDVVPIAAASSTLPPNLPK